MLDALHLRARGQELVEVAAPSGGILAVPVAPSLRPIENGLYAPAQAARRLGLRRPDWLQHVRHQRSVDRLNGQRAEDLSGVGRERRLPLRGVLGVTPARPMRVYVKIRALAERLRFDARNTLGGLGGALGFNGIDAARPLFPARVGHVSCFSEGDIGVGAEPLPSLHTSSFAASADRHFAGGVSEHP